MAKPSCALYARVSTKDKQDTENQLRDLREYCKRQGWSTAEYIDHVTGSTADRDAFRKLFEDASRKKFDIVLVWALDRFTREGVLETFEHIRNLTRYGVQFESYTEPHFRTTGPAGELMLAIAAWIAKQERIRISERVKAGLRTARAKGVQLGRRRAVFDRERARRMRSGGASFAAIAKNLGVGHSTVHRELKA